MIPTFDHLPTAALPGDSGIKHTGYQGISKYQFIDQFEMEDEKLGELCADCSS